MRSVTTLDRSCLVYSHFFNGMSKWKVRSIFSYRYYSTSSSYSDLSNLPVPVLTLNNLNNQDFIEAQAPYRKLLKGKGGIYSFINMENGNQYIGSAKDFYLRLNEHLKNKKSNIALQNAFLKYGLDKFEGASSVFMNILHTKVRLLVLKLWRT